MQNYVSDIDCAVTPSIVSPIPSTSKALFQEPTTTKSSAPFYGKSLLSDQPSTSALCKLCSFNFNSLKTVAISICFSAVSDESKKSHLAAPGDGGESESK